MSKLKRITDSISEDKIKAMGVYSLATRPNQQGQYGVSGLSPQQLKAWFDKTAHFLAKELNKIVDTFVSDEATNYIRVCLDKYGVDNLGALITAFTDGGFAKEILQLFPSAGSTQKQALQTIINKIAEDISKIYEAINFEEIEDRKATIFNIHIVALDFQIVIDLSNLVGVTRVDWGDGVINSELSHTYGYCVRDRQIKIYDCTDFGKVVGEHFYNLDVRFGDSVKIIREGAICRASERCKNITIGKNVTTIESHAIKAKNLDKLVFNAVNCSNLSGEYAAVISDGASNGGTCIIIGKDVTNIPKGLLHGTEDSSDETLNVTDVVFEDGSVCEKVGTGGLPSTDNLSGRIIVPHERFADFEVMDGMADYVSYLDTYILLSELPDLSDYLEKAQSKETQHVYTTSGNNKKAMQIWSDEPEEYSFVRRVSGGRLKGGTPTESNDLTPKEYVDSVASGGDLHRHYLTVGATGYNANFTIYSARNTKYNSIDEVINELTDLNNDFAMYNDVCVIESTDSYARQVGFFHIWPGALDIYNSAGERIIYQSELYNDDMKQL